MHSKQIHETACVDGDVEIGDGTKIWHFSHILSGSRIGDNCVIGQNVMIGPNVRIGNNVKIQNNVSVYEGVDINNDVFVGPSVVFTNVMNPRAFINRKSEFKKTNIERGATIGANATIVCGVNIGEYAFIGAGTVVIHDVEPFEKVVGNPARHLGYVCQCGNEIGVVNSSCTVCGTEILYAKK